MIFIALCIAAIIAYAIYGFRRYDRAEEEKRLAIGKQRYRIVEVVLRTDVRFSVDEAVAFLSPLIGQSYAALDDLIDAWDESGLEGEELLNLMKETMAGKEISK